MTEVVVNTGEMYVGKSPIKLKALGVGSCVITCLYDPGSQIGGMAHIMLPSRNNTDRSGLVIERQSRIDYDHPAKYADEGILEILKLMEDYGAKRSRIFAKIAGGSEMFKALTSRNISIGDSNVHAVQSALAELRVPIHAEDTGSNTSRTVTFYLASGNMEVGKRL